MQIDLRPVKSDDVDFLLDLRRKTMHEYSIEMSEESDSSDLSRIKYAFEDIQIILYQKREVGMIKITKNQSKNYWYIYQFQIDPEFQGLGIGKAILSDLCESALLNGATVGLGVYKNNPAISLYRALGFKQVSSNKHEYEMVYNA